MTRIVVPFRGAGAKIRLSPLGERERGELALAMLGDVTAACVVPHDLHTLERATPAPGLAYVPAADGTTNALGLPEPSFFAPLYGPGSADRFRAHARGLGAVALAVALPNLADDVDTVDDLRRVGLRAGPRTQAAIASLGLAA